MNRRRFLHTGVMAGAMLTASRTHARQPLNLSQSSSMSSKFELEEATVADLQSGMASGKYTARRIVEQYLARIEAVDKGTAGLNSVIELNPEALDIADALDGERRAGRVRGALHGIPVLLKDNIDTHDKMTTTAGSLALEGSVPLRDAFIVERLRQSGCVIIGKTNLSEWANFRSTRSTSGWSGRGGQTHNPYALDRNPCGSSSGSGVSVAANLCALAVGTETDGSIVCPSSASGIVGIKPTVGLVSRSGIIPISHTQDTAGTMTRTVTDAAIMLGAMTGVDSRDTVTRNSRGKSHMNYTRFLDPQGLRGARVGVLRKAFGFNPDVDELMEEAIAAMKSAGAIIIDPVAIETASKLGDSELEVLLYEFKDGINKYLATLGANAPVKSLKDIIEFNEREKAREMPYFGQELFLRAQAKGDLNSREYQLALSKNLRLSRTLGIDAAMTKHKLDAIVAPTGSPAWTTDLINGDHFSGGSSTPAAVAGYPNINVPAGFVFGLPVGISFFGRAYSEPVLIKIAYSYEQATKHRRAPDLLTQINLNAKV